MCQRRRYDGATRILWLSFGDRRGYWFTALGAHTLAGTLDDLGGDQIDQRIWYYDPDDVSSLEDQALRFEPDLLCFSVNIGFEHEATTIAARMSALLGRSAGERFVFGNRACSSLTWVRGLLQRWPLALAIDGEGEDAMKGLVRNLPPEELPNCWFLRGGTSLSFTRREQPASETIRAPCFSMPVLNTQDLRLNRCVAYVETSRGCSKIPACTFCANSRLDKGQTRHKSSWRPIPFKEIKTSIQRVASNGVTTINMVSEDLVGPDDEEFQRLLDFLQRLRETGVLPPATALYGAMKATDIFDQSDSQARLDLKQRRLRQMRAVGFRTIYVGFESGCDSQLRRYGKNSRRRDNVEVIELMRAAGLSIDGGFITFDPLVSLNEMEQNLEFLEEMRVPKLHLFPFNSLDVVPGTGYARLLEGRNNPDPAARRLLEVVQHVQSRLNFDLLERFLQELRLRYFVGDLSAARPYEDLALEYGSRAFSFLRSVSELLRKHGAVSGIADCLAVYEAEESATTARMFALLRSTTKFPIDDQLGARTPPLHAEVEPLGASLDQKTQAGKEERRFKDDAQESDCS